MPKKFESDQEAVFSMAFLTKVTNITILNFLLCQHDRHGPWNPHHHDFHPDQPEEDEAAWEGVHHHEVEREGGDDDGGDDGDDGNDDDIQDDSGDDGDDGNEPWQLWEEC